MTATAGVGERLLANTREENSNLASVTGVGLVRAISLPCFLESPCRLRAKRRLELSMSSSLLLCTDNYCFREQPFYSGNCQ